MTTDPPLVWPTLLWNSKDEPSAPPAPPLHIEERIDPAALVAGLGESVTPLSWQHGGDWNNRFILGDSLAVMTALLERERLQGAVQTIFMDPPYGIGFASNWQKNTETPDTKEGSLAHLTA